MIFIRQVRTFRKKPCGGHRRKNALLNRFVLLGMYKIKHPDACVLSVLLYYFVPRS